MGSAAGTCGDVCRNAIASLPGPGGGEIAEEASGTVQMELALGDVPRRQRALRQVEEGDSSLEPGPDFLQALPRGLKSSMGLGMVPLSERQSSERSIAQGVRPHGLPSLGQGLRLRG